MIFFAMILFHSFEVDEMAFEGNKMHLCGHFKWDHPIGLIEAKSCDLTFPESSYREMPTEAVLKEGVSLHFGDRGTLRCPFALLDLPKGLGTFHGRPDEKVVFQRESEGVLIESLLMDVDFDEEKLHSILASETVEIEMKPDLRVSCDKALFGGTFANGRFSTADLSGSPCTLRKGEQNEVFAKTIHLDMGRQVALLDAPTGRLEKNGTPIGFFAKTMEIDQKTSKMTLLPPLGVDWLGTLTSEGKLAMSQGGEKGLRSLESEGPSKLKIKDLSGMEHCLETLGTLSLDPGSKTLLIVSPKNEEGDVLEKDQIHFSDLYGEIFADTLTLSYQEIEGHVKPQKMLLEGNIRLQNKTPLGERYALADTAELLFEKSELVLKSKPPKRVLFYDPMNKVEASGASLILKRDPKTGKDIIQGVGMIRLMFAEDELNELKKRFSLDKE